MDGGFRSKYQLIQQFLVILFATKLILEILLFLGLNALASLVQVNTNLATQPAYQRVIIDCLDDPDETLKRKVLYCITK